MDSASMSNPASQVLANLVMSYILKNIEGLLPFPVPFLKVYFDDVVTAIPKDRMDQTLKNFNNVNKKIQFTMEVEKNRTLPFLDMNIIRNEDGSIVTSWYVKPTSSAPFPKAYVNDVVTAIPKDRMDQKLKTFNSVNNRIQLTMKVENIRTLPFLVMNFIRNRDSSIVTNLYVKPTSSGRCINYSSNHPISQKIGVIKGILFRALTLSSMKFHIENKKRIKLLLKNNNNPTSLIHMVFRQTKQKLKKRLEQHKKDCKPTNAQMSNITALAEHHFITGHKFKFDETDIFDREDRHTDRGHHNTEDT
ncbi:hypothetical protein M0804_014324 [Polistes exclamans]|nr:hypothetical protein M0804_014324 [Polistes exclamans]